MGSLIAISLPDGRLIEYVTDGKGRRVGKMVNGVLVKQWLYRDQLKPVAELDGAGNLMSEFIYGTKGNVPDLVIRGGATYRLVSDQLGSPLMAINTANSSDVPFQSTYAAFGERTLVGGADDWMPFGFAGGLYDPDTKLTRFGARDYDARFGRWVSKDPIRFRGGSVDLYGYVLNDPVNLTDSWGQVVPYPNPNPNPNPSGGNMGIIASIVCSAVNYVGTDAGIPGLGYVCKNLLNPPDQPPTPPCGDGQVPVCVKGACDCTPPTPNPPDMCYSNNDWNTY
jgi:RHS repeat-associated protein